MSEPLSRLRLLDTILAGSKSTLVGAGGKDIESVDLCLRSAPFDRIRQLTIMLADDRSRGMDDVDTLAAHLLLTDYRNAVLNMRTATQVVAARLTATSASLKSARGFARRQEKRAARRADRAQRAAEQSPR